MSDNERDYRTMKSKEIAIDLSPVPPQPTDLQRDQSQGTSALDGELNTEVLERIHAALEESKRLRQQVIFSELDTEVSAAVAKATAAAGQGCPAPFESTDQRAGPSTGPTNWCV